MTSKVRFRGPGVTLAAIPGLTRTESSPVTDDFLSAPLPNHGGILGILLLNKFLAKPNQTCPPTPPPQTTPMLKQRLHLPITRNMTTKLLHAHLAGFLFSFQVPPPRLVGRQQAVWRSKWPARGGTR